MKLVNDAIMIETRKEIDDIIKMIDVYLKHGHDEKTYTTREEFEELKKQLNFLSMCW